MPNDPEELKKRLQNLLNVSPSIRVSAQTNQPVQVPSVKVEAPKVPTFNTTVQKLNLSPTAPKVTMVETPKIKLPSVPYQAPKVDTRSFAQKLGAQINPFDQGLSYSTSVVQERADKRPVWSKVFDQINPADQGRTYTNQGPTQDLNWAQRNINLGTVPKLVKETARSFLQMPITAALSVGELFRDTPQNQKTAQAALNIPYEQRKAIIAASRDMTPEQIVKGGDATNPLDYRNPNYAIAKFFKDTGIDPTDANIQSYIASISAKKQESPTYTPKGKVQQFLLGKEPIKTYQQTGQELATYGAEKTGIEALKKAGPLIALGLAGFDIATFGGESTFSKPIIKSLVKETTTEGVVKIAEKAGLKLTEEEIAALAKAGTTKEVKTITKTIEERLAQEAATLAAEKQAGKVVVTDAAKAGEVAVAAGEKATVETTDKVISQLAKTTSEKTVTNFVKNTFANLSDTEASAVANAIKNTTNKEEVRAIIANAKQADSQAAQTAAKATAEQAAVDTTKVIEDKIARGEKITQQESQQLLDNATKTQVTETTAPITKEVPTPKEVPVEPVYPPKLRKKIAEGKPLSPEEEMIKADIESGKGKVGIGLRRKLNLGIPLSKREAAKARKAGFEVIIDPELAALKNEYIGQAKIHGFSQFWVTTKGLLSRLGDTGEVIANRLSAMRNAVELGQNEFFNMIPTVNKIAKGWNKKEFRQFVDALDALSRGETPQMTDRIAQAVAEWQQAIPLIRDRARAAGIDVGDLGPNYFPHIYDLDNRSNFNKAVEFLVSTKQVENAKQAENLLNQMRQDQLKNGMFSSFKKRTIELPEYDKSPAAMIRYLEGAFDNIARKEQFGANNEVISYLLKRIEDQYGTTAAKEAGRLWNIASKQGDNYSEMAMKATSLLRKFNSLTKLGTATVTNMGQNINTITSYGTKNYFESLYKYFFTPEGRAFKNETGVALDRVLENTKMNMGITEGLLGKVAVPGFNAVETFNRNLAAESAKNYAERQAKIVAEGGLFANNARRRLEEMGITGDIGAKLTPEQQIQAARKGVETTQFKIDPMDLPPWMDSPLGKTVAQFRTFGYKQTGYIYNEIIKQAMQGNMMPLVRFMTIAPVLGNAIGDTKAAITGREQQDRNPLQWYADGISNVGGLGLGIDDVKRIYDNKDSSKLPSMLVSTLFGPTAGNVAETTQNLATGIQQNYWTPLGRQAVRSVPLGLAQGRVSQKLFPYKGPETVTAPSGEKIKVKFPDGATDAQKAFLTQKAVYKKKGDEYLKTLPKETRNYVEGTKEMVDSLLQNNQIDKSTYNSIMKAKKQYDIITGKTEYVKPTGMSPSTAAYIQETNNLTEEQLNSSQNDIPSGNGKQIIDRLNSKLPAGMSKLPYTNEIARSYADFEKKWYGGDKPLKDQGIVAQKTAVKSLWRDMAVSSVSPEVKDTYNAGSNIETYIKEGLISKSMLDEAIALDDMLYKTGLSSLKFSKKVRALYGYGVPSTGTGTGGTGGKKVGLSRFNLSIPSIPKVPKFSPLSDVKMEMPTPPSSGQPSKISIKL